MLVLWKTKIYQINLKFSINFIMFLVVKKDTTRGLTRLCFNCIDNAVIYIFKTNKAL